MNTTDDRLSALEAKLAEYDRLIERLVAWAKMSPSGRVYLKLLGLP